MKDMVQVAHKHGSVEGFGPAGQMPRRHFLSLLGWSGLALALAEMGYPAGAGGAGGGSHGGHAEGMDPEAALKQLIAGNERYVARKARHPNRTVKRRMEIASGQHPFAVILGCADSRVAPEIVFDQGLGDLFVVRVAGNIANDAVIGSIEYAVAHLGSRLVVVLGHEKCGAVAAAVEVAEKGAALPGHLPAVVQPILPAVGAVRDQPGDRLDNAVRANVRLVVGRLRSSEAVLKPMLIDGRIQIVGRRYDLTSGFVDLIG